MRPSKTCEVSSWTASWEPRSWRTSSQLGQPSFTNCCGVLVNQASIQDTSVGTIGPLLTPEVRTIEQSMQARWVRELKDMVLFEEGETKIGNATGPPSAKCEDGRKA